MKEKDNFFESNKNVVILAFDLLYLNNIDYSKEPLIQRKVNLQELIKNEFDKHLKFLKYEILRLDDINCKSKLTELFKLSKENGSEGLIIKNNDN